MQEPDTRMLLPMATGTGKTFAMVNQAYRLMKSRESSMIRWSIGFPPRPVRRG